MPISPFSDATELLAALQAGEVSSVELVELYAGRIAKHNPALNAIVLHDLDRAKTLAAQADQDRQQGLEKGPLHGLPVTIKDALSTRDFITTGGSPDLASHQPERDADVVARYRAAGAIIMGKTNLPLFSGDMQSFNDVYGVTNNPWDLTRTPGGSSGGACAALAAGLTGLEIGSDIGGSIRSPSHYSGVFGHKPTFGIVPKAGHIPPPPGIVGEDSLSVVGPLARSTRDLELALGVLAGPGWQQAEGWQLDLAEPRAEELPGFRIGVWMDEAAAPLDQAVRGVLSRALGALEGAGAVIDHDAKPPIGFDELFEIYGVILSSIIMAGMPDAVIDMIRAGRDALTGDEPAYHRAMTIGATMSHREYQMYDERRWQLIKAFDDWFARYDVILMPVTQITAFPHDHHPDFNARTVSVNGRDTAYTDLLAWAAPAIISHCPATVIPAGRSEEGLPVGLQIMGRRYHDRTTLRFAKAAETVLGGFVPPPDFAG